jgi:hypothetical protein
MTMTIELKLGNTMRNRDVEKLRDALGALDYRINTLESKPLGLRSASVQQVSLHFQTEIDKLMR